MVGATLDNVQRREARNDPGRGKKTPVGCMESLAAIGPYTWYAARKTALNAGGVHFELSRRQDIFKS